jgi:hypothetical protein
MVATINNVGLCSQALILLGAQPISSLSSGTTAANTCNHVYETTKNSKLSSYRWRFAMRIQTLAQLAAGSSDNWDNDEYTYAYALPADCLAPFSLESKHEYKIYGDELYTEDDTAELIYIRDVGEEHFPPWFQEALVLEIASKIAYAITSDNALINRINMEKTKAWTLARHVDAKTSFDKGLNQRIREILLEETTSRS